MKIKIVLGFVSLVLSSPSYSMSAICGSTFAKYIDFVQPVYDVCKVKECSKLGWVKFDYIIEVNGKTSNVTIKESFPDNLRDSAVIKAVESWVFEPQKGKVECSSKITLTQ
jgi:hypothetical protein